MLRQSFESLRTVVDQLLKLDDGAATRLFHDVGNLVLREIVLNRYFRPFRPLEFRLEYDRVKSVPVLDALAQARRPRAGGCFTAAFLGAVPAAALPGLRAVRRRAGSERRASRVVLALVQERGAHPRGVPPDRARHREVTLRRHQAAGAPRPRRTSHGWPRRLAGGCARRRTTRTGCWTSPPRRHEQLRAQVVRLAAAVEARLPADESFTRLVSPVVLAQRLRNDLWVFAQLARAADEALGAASEQAVQALDALGAFLSYFQDVSYQLLRYGDLQAFDQFAAILREAEPSPRVRWPALAWREDCRAFAEAAEGASSPWDAAPTWPAAGSTRPTPGPCWAVSSRCRKAIPTLCGVESRRKSPDRTDTCVVACLLVKSWTAVATLRHAGGSRQPMHNFAFPIGVQASEPMSDASFHQRTLEQPVTTRGVGLHSGAQVNLTLRPAPADHGIVFRPDGPARPRWPSRPPRSTWWTPRWRPPWARTA